MELSHFQKRFFFENGYVLVPGVVPQVMVDEAVRSINHSVGQGMDPEKMVTFRSQSFCPELQQSEMTGVRCSSGQKDCDRKMTICSGAMPCPTE